MENYNYTQIEDKAGVEYTYGIAITALFILLQYGSHNLLGSDSLWIILTTLLSLGIWWYFIKYFKAIGDSETSKWIILIMISLLYLGLSTLIINNNSNALIIIDSTPTEESYDKFMKLSSNLVTGVWIAIFVIFVVSIKIISVNSKHPFPLKRIAFSSMLFIPLYMLFEMLFRTHFIWEAKWIMDIIFGNKPADLYSSPNYGKVGTTILMTPYFFLLHHFYRANKDDATP